MESSRVLRACLRVLAIVCVVVAATAAPARAGASEGPAGGPALRQARAAWDRGALDTAEPLYREALERGGLAPTEVLEGYVRLGSIRASHGKKDQAIAAFRAASILDATFTVPKEAGHKGRAYAAQAKKDTAKVGSLQLSVSAPKEATTGKAFVVTAHLDGAHVPIVARLALVARDGTSGKEAVAEAPPGESVDLDVSAEVTLPSASILVRVDALDRQGNRLASAEERVRVPDGGSAAVAAAPLAPAGASAASGSPSSGSAAGAPAADTGVRKGGGFWSSPWPYVIGSVALAGAAGAVYFGTRPAQQVSVGAVGVRTR